MKPTEIRRIRESLGLAPGQLAELLGLSGYGSMMNIENGVRNPNRLAMKVLLYIDSLSKKNALAFIEELNRHEPN